MRSALLEASPGLCVHVERNMHDAQGTLHKIECKIDLDRTCLVPIFCNQSLTYEQAEYQIVAIMSHLGQDAAGHYRTAVRIAPTLVDSITPAEWLLTDDWVPPTATWVTPQWMTRSANLFWLIRSDCVHLLNHVPRTPLRDITEAIAKVTDS